MCAIFLNLLSELSRKEHNILLFTWTHKYLAPCIFKDDFRETNELKWLCTSSWRSKFGGWTVWSLLIQTIQPRPYKRMDVKSKKQLIIQFIVQYKRFIMLNFFTMANPKTVCWVRTTDLESDFSRMHTQCVPKLLHDFYYSICVSLNLVTVILS